MASQADRDADQSHEMHRKLQIECFYGSKMLKITKPPMECNINCKAANIVAMVVPDLKTEADDAVELVLASFDPLQAVTDAYAAMADGVL